jgi:predicted transcriptional regulator
MARPPKTDFGRLVAHCFGTVLREYRKAAYMSQGTLATEARVDRRYVQLLENGTSQPTLEMVLRLSRALKVGIGDAVVRTESLVVKEEASATGYSGNAQSARAGTRPASPKRLRRAKRAGAV